MVKFLDFDVEGELNYFVQVELSNKYQQRIELTDIEMVTGLSGSEVIVEALAVRFFPKDAKVEWVENKIMEDIHRYCYDHDIHLSFFPVIERTPWLGEIRYGLIYLESL